MTPNLSLHSPLHAHLYHSREHTAAKLDDRIRFGRELLDENLSDEDGLERLKQRERGWHDYNLLLLRTLFREPTAASRYGAPTGEEGYGRGPLDERTEQVKFRIAVKVMRLESLRKDLVV
jgi:hypothetical protein